MRVTKIAIVDTRHIVIVDGEKFELFDLYETLQSMNDGVSNIRITNPRMVKVLKARGVIDYEGNRDIPARKGTNFDSFLAELEPKANKAYRGKYTVTKASIRKARQELDEMEN